MPVFVEMTSAAGHLTTKHHCPFSQRPFVLFFDSLTSLKKKLASTIWGGGWGEGALKQAVVIAQQGSIMLLTLTPTRPACRAVPNHPLMKFWNIPKFKSG